MNVSEVLSNLRGKGLHVRLVDDVLYVGPQSKLTDDDVALVRAYKSALIDFLAIENAPKLGADGSLRIPFSSPVKYRYWLDGAQSIWTTLAELNAGVESWKQYALVDPELLTDAHAAHCDGNVRRQQGFAFCVKCGRYTDEENHEQE